jgi:hypothetical protein
MGMAISVHLKWGIHLAPPVTPWQRDQNQREANAEGTPDGSFHGRQAIEKHYARQSFQDHHANNRSTTVDRVIAVGNEVRATGRWSETYQESGGGTVHADGRCSWVFVREGDTWKKAAPLRSPLA